MSICAFHIAKERVLFRITVQKILKNVRFSLRIYIMSSAIPILWDHEGHIVSKNKTYQVAIDMSHTSRQRHRICEVSRNTDTDV